MPTIGSVTITPATALYTNPISDSAITASTSTREGRTAIVLDFNGGDGLYARDLGTIFQWPTGARPILDVWQPSVIELPENTYNRATDWMDGGTAGAKFFQGLILEADTFNVAKSFQLQDSDTLQFHPFNETPATFHKQSTKAFSCTPFIAHSVRLVTTDSVPWRMFNSTLVFEPFPEITSLWQTEMTSLGMTGWAHLREMNIAHISTADLTLTIAFDSWPAITITIPNSAGRQAKVKQTIPINKWKLISFTLSSNAPFRVFEKDIELKVKPWGSAGAYSVLKPFGGKSSPGADV